MRTEDRLVRAGSERFRARQHHLEVGALHGPRTATTSAPASEGALAEEGIEDVAETTVEEGVGIGGSLTSPTRSLGTEHVVAATALGIPQGLVGGRHLLEALLGVRVTAVGVRMQLAGQATVGPPDVVISGVVIDLEQFVEVGWQEELSLVQAAPELSTDNGDSSQGLGVVHAGRAEHPDGACVVARPTIRCHDHGAFGQRHHAVLGADGDRQAAVEDVAQHRDDDVLLLEDGEHAADRLDRLEGGGHAGRPAHEHVLRLLAVAGRGERSQAGLDHRIGLLVARGDGLADITKGLAHEVRAQVRGRRRQSLWSGGLVDLE